MDTNALPHGHFNGKALRHLRNIVGVNSSVVVPEVVVWEWAEHAHRAQLALSLTVEQHRVDPAIIPRSEVPAAPPIEDVIAAVTSALVDARVEIWSPKPETWKDAIRQQILQVGSGEVKKDVKTGAADAVVLACAEELRCVFEPPVILLSSDSRLRSRAAEEVDDLFVANGIRDVLKQLSDFEPAPEDLEVRAAEVLPDVLNERIAEGSPVLSFDDFGVELYAGDGRYSADLAIPPQTIDFRRVDVVEFHDFEIAHVDESRFGLGQMRIFGDFELVFLERRETSPGVLELVGDVAGPFSMGYVDVTVAIHWDLGWQFKDITPTGVAVAVLGNDDDEGDTDDVPTFRASEASPAPPGVDSSEN